MLGSGDEGVRSLIKQPSARVQPIRSSCQGAPHADWLSRVTAQSLALVPASSPPLSLLATGGDYIALSHHSNAFTMPCPTHHTVSRRPGRWRPKERSKQSGSPTHQLPMRRAGARHHQQDRNTARGSNQRHQRHQRRFLSVGRARLSKRSLNFIDMLRLCTSLPRVF